MAENKVWLLAEMEQQILYAARAGLWPDSELVVLQEGAEAGEIYKVLVKDDEERPDDGNYIITFERVESGRAFHVGVAARYNRTLKPGEWVATVHVHS